MCVQAKETQQVTCVNLAERLEEGTLKLATARYEIRDARRKLSDYSDQLGTTKHALQATEIQLKDANDELNRTKRNQCKQTKITSNSPTEGNSSCIGQLMEAHADLKAKDVMLKDVSSHLTQLHEEKLLAAATAEECSLHRKWLQPQVEECMVISSQDPVVKGNLSETKERGCSCEDTNTIAHCDGDKTTNSEEKFIARNLATEKDGNCTWQPGDLKTQEMMMGNCSRRLAQERESRLKVTATEKARARQINRVRSRLELKTVMLNECSMRLIEADENLTAFANALEHCASDLSSLQVERASAGVRECGDRQSAKLKDVSAKLAKCSEELTTAGETVRWKTQQNERCAENLVKERGRVQTLTTRLSDPELSCDHIIEQLRHRHQDLLDDLNLCHEREITERTTQGCVADEDQPPVNSYIKLLIVPLIMEGYLWLIWLTSILLMWLVYHLMKNRFETFLGIRGRRVEYGVRFRRRYR